LIREEVFIIQRVISNIIASDTGFADPDKQLYLDHHYKVGKTLTFGNLI
jgi:hypothetical protein